jgi:cytochrome c-type biogenesis protein CcsB
MFFSFMDSMKMLNFFGNSSFFLLFFSTISYWVEISFNLQKWNVGRISMLGANFCLLSLLILRWFESGHFPLSNLYESLMFLSWSLSTFHLLLENIEIGTNKFFGAFTAPTALFINAFATFRLPPEMQESAPLVPALQSNWLMMHVTVMILSYAALICGSLLSIAFLIVSRDNDLIPKKILQSSSTNASLRSQLEASNGENEQISSEKTTFSFSGSLDGMNPPGIEKTLNFENTREGTLVQKNLPSFKRKFVENLDNLSYRILGIGFPLLTIGILSGAVWANEAWGSYWSWDPKETWALATWFVFAIYLHTRLTKGWSGKKPAIIASVGFLTVWICFLGVNLLGEGLHSYGFLKDSFSKL